jgi:hypothetical protein
VCWAHDDTAVPGKTYRYRMKVLFKNPLYGTAGLAKEPKDENKYVLDTAAPEWSDWSKDVRVPPTTRYFFAQAKQAMARGAVVNAVVDVFKREKGKWVKGTFTVTPGDSIGQPQGFVDYTTGDTLVDLRSEFRGDVRIITADQGGELRSSPLSQYVKDPEYLDLQNQLRAAADAAAAAGGAVPVVPANYNTPGYNAPGARPNGARPNRILREGEGGG